MDSSDLASPVGGPKEGKLFLSHLPLRIWHLLASGIQQLLDLCEIPDFSSSHIYFPVLGSASNIILSKRSWLHNFKALKAPHINGNKSGILSSCHLVIPPSFDLPVPHSFDDAEYPNRSDANLRISNSIPNPNARGINSLIPAV